MSKTRYCWFVGLTLLAGCDWPGQPNVKDKFIPPTEVKDFARLFTKNCAGCHGKDGQLGPAPPLNDAVFLAIVPEEELRKVIAAGRKGTSMPAFAIANGGTLTEAQVQILATGLKATWGKSPPTKTDWPPYLALATKGDAGRGKVVFAKACAMCHGDDGTGTNKVGPINDRAFLSLASEQMLRRIVITGRADLGMPNCVTGDGRPLSAADVDDVTALMLSWKR